jgi:hypothetical protein
MTTRVYATYTDYTSYTSDAVTTQSRVTLLLTKASVIIDRALIGAVYATDPQGYPTDAGLLDVVMKATCEQVLFMVDLDDDTGAKQRFQSVTVGNVTFQRAQGTAGNARIPLAPGAMDLLQVAGVLGVAPMINW